MKEYRFVATCSGDGECFEFAVDDEEVFRHIVGEEIYQFDKEYRESLKADGFDPPEGFRISPNHIFGFGNSKKKIHITVEEITDGGS